MTEHALPFYEPSGNEIAFFEHAFRERLPLLIKDPYRLRREGGLSKELSPTPLSEFPWLDLYLPKPLRIDRPPVGRGNDAPTLGIKWPSSAVTAAAVRTGTGART